ncbi:unnamed protein product [Cuscuta epithymum]|uniref:RING-CH-type domain-containing protein n=1 Tax=Cuscuta epithymum TaxID=186058 RepID=A0AAV0ETA1_9ASTE|nr:unnamed protein product [Cuscuta epithymum]
MQSLHRPDVDSEAGSCRNGCGCHSSAVSGGGHGGCGSSSSTLDAEKLQQQRRISSVSSECFVEVDLEAPSKEEAKLHSKKDCRICHLSIDLESQESGVIFELGCSCKNDLAAAHKHCAEAWFKIKGNSYQTLALFCIGSAMSTMSLTLLDNTPYMDSGATSHMTFDKGLVRFVDQ